MSTKREILLDPATRIPCSANIIPSEVRSYCDSAEIVSSVHFFFCMAALKGHSCSSGRARPAPPLALMLANMVSYLQENTESLQPHKFAGFASS